MALPPSGTLSLNDITGEFGGPGSPSLGDYYAGGSYVPSGTSGTNGPVPTNGTISIANFYGTSAAISIELTAGSYASYDQDGALIATYDGFVDAFIGSISPTTFAYAGGATIVELFTYGDWLNNTGSFSFVIVGYQPNSGWTDMIVPGLGTFSRASASYLYNGDTFWRWYFDTPTNTVSSCTVTVTP